eukprot:1996977-Pyramimonas_sp.AAC.1
MSVWSPTRSRPLPTAAPTKNWRCDPSNLWRCSRQSGPRRSSFAACDPLDGPRSPLAIRPTVLVPRLRS